MGTAFAMASRSTSRTRSRARATPTPMGRPTRSSFCRGRIRSSRSAGSGGWSSHRRLTRRLRRHSVLSGPSGTVSADSASFAFSSSEAGSTFQCRRDGGVWEACSSPKAYFALANGSHTFDVRATDAAGNTDASPASQAWTVDVPPPPLPADTTPPQTTIDSGPSGTVATGSASFSFNSSESGSTFSCRVDGGVWSSCGSPRDYAGLGDGSHTFDVRATDGGEYRWSPASRTWT